MVEKKPVSTWGPLDTAKAKKEPETEEKSSITFEKLSPKIRVPKLKIAVHGQQKTGKTRFAMSSSINNGPTYIIPTEPGIFPLARLFPDNEIYFVKNRAGEPTVYEINYEGTFEVEATRTLENIDKAVRQIRQLCLEDTKNVGSVAVDSVTDVWKWVSGWMMNEILKLDKTARIKQQWDWKYANEKYQNIIMQLISLPCHVILTAQDKEAYVGAGSPSGEFEPRWQKQTPYWVDIVIGMYKKKNKATGKIEYWGEIEDARHMDATLEPIAGITVQNPTFDKLVKIVKGEKIE